GVAVSAAAAAAAASAPSQLARVLRRAADLLALGADPSVAWSISPRAPASSVDAQTDALLRLARRSASSGAALAGGVEDLADQCRHGAAHAATAAAERAGVLIAGPLGLCFLPAFVCLGIVPVVAGLAGDVLKSGLLWKGREGLMVNMVRAFFGRLGVVVRGARGVARVSGAPAHVAA